MAPPIGQRVRAGTRPSPPRPPTTVVPRTATLPRGPTTAVRPRSGRSAGPDHGAAAMDNRATARAHGSAAAAAGSAHFNDILADDGLPIAEPCGRAAIRCP